MRGNRAGDAIRKNGGNGYVSISDCLLAENLVARQLIRWEGESFGGIANCTIARNTIGSTDVIHNEDRVSLASSIIDQPGHLTIAFSGQEDQLVVSNMLASDITTLPAHPSIISGAPSFVDAANGNYRLCQDSPAVDFAEPVVGDDRDLDNLPRDQDIPEVPDLFGVRDLGAYELQPGTPGCGAGIAIFANGFED